MHEKDRESQQLSESRAELGTQAPDAETQQIVVEELRETLKKRLEINDALPTNIENNIHDESATLCEALVSRCTECTEDAEFTESTEREEHQAGVLWPMACAYDRTAVSIRSGGHIRICCGRFVILHPPAAAGLNHAMKPHSRCWTGIGRWTGIKQLVNRQVDALRWTSCLMH